MKKIRDAQPWLLMFALCAIAMLVPHASWAAVSGVPDGTCTSDPMFALPTPTAGNGLISTIISNIHAILLPIAQSMFTSITTNTGFQHAIKAVVTLYVCIYGFLFTFGMVQISLFDFAIRCAKIGILALLVSSNSWNFFNSEVVRFFNNGTDQIIGQVTQITVGGISDPYSPTPNSSAAPGPFTALDNAIGEAISAKMAVTIMAIFTTGPYGIIFGLLLLMSLGSFFKAVINALWVYVMSLVLKTLLFGLAPIFIGFLLFNRTRHLFDGWLNMVINASLQPILLFIFFAFFVQLMLACIDNVVGPGAVPVCWTEWAESLRGSPFSTHYWRFALFDSSQGQYAPYGGIWDFSGPQGGGGGNPFPIDLMTILVFLILAELAGRFNHIVVQIAQDLAGAATDLRMGGGEMLGRWFSSGPGGGGLGGALRNRGATSAIGSRFGTGGNVSRPSAGGGVAPGGGIGLAPGSTPSRASANESIVSRIADMMTGR